MPKAWKFFEVTHSTWRTLDNCWDFLRSVGMISILITYVELWRGDLMKGGEFRTFLHL
jgi:hypothetical protein